MSEFERELDRQRVTALHAAKMKEWTTSYATDMCSNVIAAQGQVLELLQQFWTRTPSQRFETGYLLTKPVDPQIAAPPRQGKFAVDTGYVLCVPSHHIRQDYELEQRLYGSTRINPHDDRRTRRKRLKRDDSLRKEDVLRKQGTLATWARNGREVDVVSLQFHDSLGSELIHIAKKGELLTKALNLGDLPNMRQCLANWLIQGGKS